VDIDRHAIAGGNCHSALPGQFGFCFDHKIDPFKGIEQMPALGQHPLDKAIFIDGNGHMIFGHGADSAAAEDYSAGGAKKNKSSNGNNNEGHGSSPSLGCKVKRIERLKAKIS
jgi:hypothetical protein